MTSFPEFVENKISNGVTDRTIKCAAASFLATFTPQCFKEVTVESLQAWIATMMTAGLQPSSRRKYLAIMEAFYREWNKEADAAPFEMVKKLAAVDIKNGITRTDANLGLVHRLLNVSHDSDDFETVNIFLYLLFNVEAGMQEVINLKFDKTTPPLSQLDDIIEGMHRMSMRKKYVFGLDQGKKREGQILKELLHKLTSATGRYGLDFGSEFSRLSITAIWIAAAFKAGVPASVISSMVTAVPPEYPHLQYLRQVQLTTADRISIMQKVADSLHDGASRWFVMRLRSGKTPDNIEAAILETDSRLHQEITFYYPMHTVVVTDKNGKKKKECKPYLPGILFFKLRKDRVACLFRNIGDLAWCYKWTNTPDSPYCIIPAAEMRTFQKHVGSFTPDIEMSLVTRDTPLAIDQQVRINGGGPISNRIGIIRSVKNSNGTRTYTLALSSHDCATWTVKDVEEIYLDPIDTDSPSL